MHTGNIFVAPRLRIPTESYRDKDRMGLDIMLSCAFTHVAHSRGTCVEHAGGMKKYSKDHILTLDFVLGAHKIKRR